MGPDCLGGLDLAHEGIRRVFAEDMPREIRLDLNARIPQLRPDLRQTPLPESRMRQVGVEEHPVDAQPRKDGPSSVSRL